MSRRHAVAIALMLSILAIAVPPAALADEGFVIRITGSPADTFTVPLNTDALTYQRGWRNNPGDRPGPDGRPILGTSIANTPTYRGIEFGLQARLTPRPNGALELWLGWQHSAKAGTQVNTTLEYDILLDDIYCFAPPCRPPRQTQRVDEQTNTTRVIQDTISFGASYDILHTNTHVVVAPGIGIQNWTVALNQRNNITVWRYIYPLVGDGPLRRELIKEGSAEHSSALSNLNGIVSLDLQFWPERKRTGLALVAEGRYIIGNVEYNPTDTTLLETYPIPVRQRRWQASVGLAAGF